MFPFKVDIVKLASVLGVFILAYLLYNGKQDKDQYINQLLELNYQYDSIMKLKDSSDQIIANLHKEDSVYLDKIGDLKGDLKGAKKENQAKTQKINDLASSILEHGAIDEELKENCDSLAKLAQAREQDILSYHKTVDTLIANYDSSLAKKDLIILEQRKQIGSVTTLLGNYRTAADAEINKLKPRTKVYVGPEIIGKKGDPIAGYGLAGDLVNKRGMIYTAGVHNINSVTYYSGGIKFLLTVKKK